MPCYDHRDHEPDPRIDQYADWLCQLNSVIDLLEQHFNMIVTRSPELEEWWEEHKAFDEARGAS